MYGMPSKPAELPRHESLGYQVNHLARLLAAALKERIEPHGVVPGQFAQLLALFEQDGVSQSELCRQVQIDQSTMAHTLKRMERDGLVSRSSDAADQRRAVITLTARARELAPTLVGAAREVNASAVAGVSRADLDTCMRVLAAAIDNLKEGSP
jgi:DNA-binding MarR family transcriptional regulator